jgi:LPS-assembly protein
MPPAGFVVCAGNPLRCAFYFALLCLLLVPGTASYAAPDGALSDWGSCSAPALPPMDLPETTATLTAGELEIFSGKAEFKLDGDARFSDQITLRRGDRVLRAKNAKYDSKSGVFEVEGDVEYRDSDARVRGSDARFDSVKSELRFNAANFEIWSVPARGSAKDIKIDKEKGKIRLREATYTSCPVGNNDWQLRAKTIRIDQDAGIGTARGAKLDFKGIPILYLPYISYPVTNKRKSGWLIPDLGNSQSRGVDIAAPWYWNIAPEYDATITPRYMSKRGLQLGTEFRYLSKRSDGIMTGEFLPDDDITGENRWLGGWYQQTQLWSDWRGTLDFIDVSDANYFEDFSSGIANTSITNLERDLGIEFFNNPWSILLRVQDHITLDDAITPDEEPYKRLPQLAIHGQSPRGLFGLRYNLITDATYFERDVGVTGFRTHLAPEVGLPLRFKYFNLEPSVGVEHTRYNLSDTAPGEDDSPDVTAGIYSLDLNSIFERATKNSNWLQTLEPRALYSYIPFKNQDDLPVFDTIEPDLNIVQLFRRNRFVGYDRLGDTNQLALGITTRLLDANDGNEVVHATVGQLRYFSDQKVTLPDGMPSDDNSSDYVFEFGARIYENWRTRLGYQWDSDESEAIKTEVGLQYNPEDSRIVNAAYRYRRDTLEEYDIAMSWPIGDRWNFVGRYNYSIQDSEPLERYVGLEYETCCWGIRAVWSRYLTRPDAETTTTAESDTSISVQLLLKGFSGTSNSSARELERGILGYD